MPVIFRANALFVGVLGRELHGMILATGVGE